LGFGVAGRYLSRLGSPFRREHRAAPTPAAKPTRRPLWRQAPRQQPSYSWRFLLVLVCIYTSPCSLPSLWCASGTAAATRAGACNRQSDDIDIDIDIDIDSVAYRSSAPVPVPRARLWLARQRWQ
jgi:hypothetical protein